MVNMVYFQKHSNKALEGSFKGAKNKNHTLTLGFERTS